MTFRLVGIVTSSPDYQIGFGMPPLSLFCTTSKELSREFAVLG